jgi:hypothetical protein
MNRFIRGQQLCGIYLSWLTVTVVPATVSVPVRAAPVVLRATVILTGSLPVPLAPELIVIQELPLATTAVQEQ